MIKTKSKEKLIRNTLGTLLLIMAINAFGGGYYGISGAKDIPKQWLSGSPFDNYLIPSLILFICVGGSAVFAAIFVLKKHSFARKASFSCGIIVLTWIITQLIIIGYVSWMQSVTAIAGTCILLLTWMLPQYEA